MRFKNNAEKLGWLKAAGERIRQMEYDRKIAIVSGDFGRAYELLRGMQFARQQFKKISDTLKRF